ncbi:MAG: MFS transporter [Phycisphaerales bacterium]|nr:MFS transporter [Phycisphaerales bacterium]
MISGEATSSNHEPVSAAGAGESPLPGARVALILLLSINLWNYIDRYILAAVQPLIQKELFEPNDKDVKTKIGLLATAFLISYMVMAPIFGWLADRAPRWTLIGLGVLLWSAASAGSGLATGFTFLLIMRILVGVGEAAYGPTAPTLIADLYPASRRGTVLSWFYIAIPVGSALGYILGGTVANLSSWHWAFLITLPPGIVLAACCWFMKEPARGHADRAVRSTTSSAPAPTRRSTLVEYKTILRTPSYLLCTLGMTAMTFAVGGIAFWMPEYVHVYRNGGRPDDTEALAVVNYIFGGLTVVTGIVATLFGGWLADRLRTKIRGAYLVVSGLAMLVCFPLLVATLYIPFPYAWGTLALAMFFLFMNTGPSNTVLANVVHPSVRATAFAINIFVIHALGDAISPFIIGAMVTASGPTPETQSFTPGFLLVSFAILLGGLLWLWGSRTLDRDTAKVNAGA